MGIWTFATPRLFNGSEDGFRCELVDLPVSRDGHFRISALPHLMTPTLSHKTPKLALSLGGVLHTPLELTLLHPRSV
jgi:hypothetical protein